MSYKQVTQSFYTSTAGKITIFTSLVGVAVFIVAFAVNLGSQEFQKVSAQIATSSVTVLNTAPSWLASSTEEVGSATSSPTNSGLEVAWVGTASDSNNEDYFLLICDGSATPTPSNNFQEPECGPGDLEWAVSPAASSGVQARAATTTNETALFVERKNWYAWICDSVATSSRCNSAFTQGTSTVPNQFSSPFHVNRRPLFTGFADYVNPAPGDAHTFFSTSTDPDSVGGTDTLQLVVCNDPDYATSTNSCGAGGTLATSTFVTDDAGAAFTVAIPTQDQTYTAYGYVVDEHGHEASGGSQGNDAVLIVSNVAPVAIASQISLNSTSSITLSVEGGETPNITLSYIASDNNSCQRATGLGGGDEITDYILSVYRSGIGPVACDGTGINYDPNNCYPSGVGSAVWNLSCTASSTSCSGSSDTTQLWECTFPLWYVADPTEDTAAETFYFAEDWRAAVSPVDDNFATGTLTASSNGQELEALLAISLNSNTIAYGEVEPGSQTSPLPATTSVAATGNVGIDQNIEGESMCQTYETGSTCPNSSSSTINAAEQVYATSSLAYNDLGVAALSSTTPVLHDIDVAKTTSTSTPNEGVTYWGINVPSSITFAGVYTGETLFQAVTSDPSEWGL